MNDENMGRKYENPQCRDTRSGRVIIRAKRGRYSIERLYRLKDAIEFVLRVFDHVATEKLIKNMYVDERQYQLVIDVPYAYFLETGSKAHVPNYECLLVWAMKKFDMRRNEARRFAWHVFNTIKSVGTERTEYITKALRLVDMKKIDVVKLGKYSYLIRVKLVK